MARWMLAIAVVFGLTLALLLAFRLERSSLAVVSGVVLGIVAGLPVNGVLLYMLWRERTARQAVEVEREESLSARQAQYPPVVIVSGGRPGLEALPAGGFALGQQRQRDFVIVGEEDLPVSQ
ncbi:MAG: hypothetical protein JXA37_09355 [Chloroflexia bacterium]|nr:hypothetical protein [Chloroflexia bacterium]